MLSARESTSSATKVTSRPGATTATLPRRSDNRPSGPRSTSTTTEKTVKKRPGLPSLASSAKSGSKATTDA